MVSQPPQRSRSRQHDALGGLKQKIIRFLTLTEGMVSHSDFLVKCFSCRPDQPEAGQSIRIDPGRPARQVRHADTEHCRRFYVPDALVRRNNFGRCQPCLKAQPILHDRRANHRGGSGLSQCSYTGEKQSADGENADVFQGHSLFNDFLGTRRNETFLTFGPDAAYNER